MPEEEKKKESPVSTEPMVDIDTSGPEIDVTVDEKKEEAVVDTAPETTTEEVVTENKETEKKEDEKLEDYSKGVANRHHVSYEDVGEMGALAAQLALKNAGLSLNDIEIGRASCRERV